MKANGKEPKLAKKKQPVFSSRTNLPSTQDTRDKQDMKIRAPTNFQHPEDQPTRMGQEKEAPDYRTLSKFRKNKIGKALGRW